MNRAKNSGFTIVESLIVLGVSGALFVSMAILVSGQQAKARFRSAMSDVTTQIQQTINEVSSGHYPSTGNFTCSASGSTVDVSGGSADQGSNEDCTFLGRAMMFGIPSTDPEEYRIHTVVGLREVGTGGQPMSLQQAGARAVAPGTGTGGIAPTTFPDISTQKYLQYGMTLAWAKNGLGTSISGFAVVFDPSAQVSYSAGGSVLESGTVIPSIIPISHDGGSNPGLSSQDGVDYIAKSIGVISDPAETSSSQGPIQLCFASGTTEQSGLVTVGAANSTTSIDFLVFNSVDCT